MQVIFVFLMTNRTAGTQSGFVQVIKTQQGRKENDLGKHTSIFDLLASVSLGDSKVSWCWKLNLMRCVSAPKCINPVVCPHPTTSSLCTQHNYSYRSTEQKYGDLTATPSVHQSHQFYLRSLWCVQYEVWQLFKHLVEGAGHVTLWQQLAGQIGEQAGGQLSVAGLAFEGQGHSQGGELILMYAQVELLQQHLTEMRT